MLMLAGCGDGGSSSTPTTGVAAASATSTTRSNGGAPTVTLSPDRGPCDGVVKVTLAGFSPKETVHLDIGLPRSDGVAAGLDAATTDASGEFVGDRSLGAGGCSAARADVAVPPGGGSFPIYAGFKPESLAVAARASYAYTSTEAATATSPLALTSDAFADGGTIPVKHSCSGGGTSPALAWSGTLSGTQSFTLIVHDPDAPLAGGFTHWIVIDLPATVRSIPEAAPAGATVTGSGGLSDGTMSAGLLGTQIVAYRGMCPPVGAAPHHYHFRLYALDASLGAAAGQTKESVEAAMQGHILAQTDLVGLFGR